MYILISLGLKSAPKDVKFGCDLFLIFCIHKKEKQKATKENYLSLRLRRIIVTLIVLVGSDLV